LHPPQISKYLHGASILFSSFSIIFSGVTKALLRFIAFGTFTRTTSPGIVRGTVKRKFLPLPSQSSRRYFVTPWPFLLKLLIVTSYVRDSDITFTFYFFDKLTTHST